MTTGWHLNRSVPVTLIATILVQSAVAIWWAAGVNATVNRLALESDKASDIGSRIVRLETKMETNERLLTQILAELQKR